MSQKIRVLLADDEALGRRELRRLLKVHADLEIVAEAEDGDQAGELIEKYSPDLVFLDIRMPGRDGFGVLDALEPPLPEIVFSTAYDQFAVDAIHRGGLGLPVEAGGSRGACAGDREGAGTDRSQRA